MKASREQRRLAAIESASYPQHCVLVPMEKWPMNMPLGLVAVWRSRHFLVQVFDWKEGAKRLTVCRTQLNKNGDWQEQISWDDLQRIKSECGFADKWAVEVFPTEYDLVNVANMRHLFVLPSAPSFGWKRS